MCFGWSLFVCLFFEFFFTVCLLSIPLYRKKPVIEVIAYVSKAYSALVCTAIRLKLSYRSACACMRYKTVYPCLRSLCFLTMLNDSRNVTNATTVKCITSQTLMTNWQHCSMFHVFTSTWGCRM